MRITSDTSRQVGAPLGATARAAARLTRETGRIFTGRSQVAPDRGDPRFRDPAWRATPPITA